MNHVTNEETAAIRALSDAIARKADRHPLVLAVLVAIPNMHPTAEDARDMVAELAKRFPEASSYRESLLLCEAHLDDGIGSAREAWEERRMHGSERGEFDAQTVGVRV